MLSAPHNIIPALDPPNFNENLNFRDVSSAIKYEYFVDDLPHEITNIDDVARAVVYEKLVEGGHEDVLEVAAVRQYMHKVISMSAMDDAAPPWVAQLNRRFDDLFKNVNDSKTEFSRKIDEVKVELSGKDDELTQKVYVMNERLKRQEFQSKIDVLSKSARHHNSKSTNCQSLILLPLSLPAQADGQPAPALPPVPTYPGGFPNTKNALNAIQADDINALLRQYELEYTLG